ncbi:hypothetical protein [Stenotrophomonas sp.]|uniref:hypothetical protein n=1 Tax=Stenotrophomonas sp. TaxID=69392 RepID=UPI0028AB5981|nr:hypothetical protein [Stenotrophomonas sp.]
MTPRAYAWAAAIVVLGLLLACGSRYITRPTRIGGVVSAPECDEASMLAAMRQWLRPEVDFSESTGIYLDAADPADEEALTAYAALARICPPPAGRRADDAGAFAERLARIASGFIMEGTLEPGRYVLTGTAGGPGGDAVVAVTSEHLALLRSMNTRPYGRAVMLMDSKRPYGDMSYFYIDLARALGEPVPLDASGRAAFAPEVTARYDQLHEQMIGVVRVFWRFAEPAPSSS